MSKRVTAKTLGWEDIRRFLVCRKFLRGCSSIAAETYDTICDRKTTSLSVTLMRELSVFIAGYLRARR